jgi:hypothetical protein
LEEIIPAVPLVHSQAQLNKAAKFANMVCIAITVYVLPWPHLDRRVLDLLLLIQSVAMTTPKRDMLMLVYPLEALEITLSVLAIILSLLVKAVAVPKIMMQLLVVAIMVKVVTMEPAVFKPITALSMVTAVQAVTALAELARQD